MSKKYEMLDDFKVHMGKKLYRIVALKDIERYGVKAGDLGGWIEKEENLSQSGDCWVGGNAMVYDDAQVFSDAWIYDDAVICECALVHGEAYVYDNAVINGKAHVLDKAHVYDNAVIRDCAIVSGNVWVFDRTVICGNAEVYKDTDYLYLNSFGTIKDIATAFRCKDNLIKIKSGSLYCAIGDFKERILNLYDGKQKEVYLKFAELVEIYFKSEVKKDE